MNYLPLLLSSNPARLNISSCPDVSFALISAAKRIHVYMIELEDMRDL